MNKMISKERNEENNAIALKFMARQMTLNLIVIMLTLNNKRLFISKTDDIDFIYANTSLILPLVLFLLINISTIFIYQHRVDKK